MFRSGGVNDETEQAERHTDHVSRDSDDSNADCLETLRDLILDPTRQLSNLRYEVHRLAGTTSMVRRDRRSAQE
jgi:hypothetical protein